MSGILRYALSDTFDMAIPPVPVSLIFLPFGGLMYHQVAFLSYTLRNSSSTELVAHTMRTFERGFLDHKGNRIRESENDDGLILYSSDHMVNSAKNIKNQ